MKDFFVDKNVRPLTLFISHMVQMKDCLFYVFRLYYLLYIPHGSDESQREAF